jgi:2-polyprenyl-3-methyl-5-hydroxy-6-metoxy-1,4-benzoquinol methylase
LFLRTHPTLAYLYRSYLALKLLCHVPAGRFLEIGVGSGKFYEELESRGFWGLCLDLNAQLIQEHQTRRGAWEGSIQFQSVDFFSLQGEFDLVLAFEVLEHYRDDQACLRKWESLLQPGGTLIFSVPAHMRHWTRNDTCAGHARRYEKSELIKKLSAAGFRIQEFYCYGFPVLNGTYLLSSILFRGRLQDDSPPGRGVLKERSESYLADFDKTAQSGTRRFPWLSKWLLHEALWWPVLQLQKPFLKSDHGIGYMVKCRKA